MPTLLEDLEAAADVLRLQEANFGMKPLDSTLGARLRDHARRLREEMERANIQRGTTADFGEVESSRCLDAICRVVERINGGPTPEGER